MGFFGFITKIFDVNFLAHHNNRLTSFLNRIINGCHIDPKVKIPKSTYIQHGGIGLVIGRGVKLKENVFLYHNITLGRKKPLKKGEDKTKGYPTIESNVVIGTGSIILGDITIEKNSFIGAGTYIDKNVPKNSIVYNKRELMIKNVKK